MALVPIPLADLREIRAWVGADPDLHDLEDRYEALGNVAHAVALQVLRERRAQMVLDGPGKFDASGDTSEDWTANLASIERQITALEGSVDATSTPSGLHRVTTSQLVRPERRYR